MRFPVDFSKVSATPTKPSVEIRNMLREAKQYLREFKWCKRIRESFVGILEPGIVAVFLFRIEPGSPDVDDWVWVVVGDIPSAYITTDDAPNPASALDGYIGAMYEWVDAAKKGMSVDEIIPVNVPPTPENATDLQWRLKALEDELLRNYKHDLRS